LDIDILSIVIIAFFSGLGSATAMELIKIILGKMKKHELIKKAIE
jgi:hypothetical protein